MYLYLCIYIARVVCYAPSSCPHRCTYFSYMCVSMHSGPCLFPLHALAFRCQEWEAAYITFEVQAANAFWRNTLLGLVTVQLRLVQLRKTHQLRKALPLQHPEDTDIHVSRSSLPAAPLSQGTCLQHAPNALSCLAFRLPQRICLLSSPHSEGRRDFSPS